MESQLRDLTVHYEEVGTGRPLLILHGWGLNGRMMMPLFEPLFETRPGWRRLYLDLPGHGQTPVPDGLHEHDDVLDIVLEFIDQVAPEERFTVVGISWGGYLTRGVLHHRLKQLDGLLFFVPAIHWDTVARDRPAKLLIRPDAEFVAALHPGEEWLAEEAVAQSRPMLDDVRVSMAYWTPQDSAIQGLLNGKLFTFDPDVLPEACAAPTLFITGRQDRSVGYKEGWPLLDSFPRASFVVLDRAGHLLGFEQPVVFRALGNEWLDRVEEYIAQNAHS